MAVDAQKVLLSDILAQRRHVPIKYVRPVYDRPNLTQVLVSPTASIPVVDLAGMDGPDRAGVVNAIRLACESHGFFQVKNHGVPEHVVEGMLEVSRKFFKLPESERMENYSDNPMKTTRLSTSFNVKTEKLGCWRDYLRLHCYPLEDFVDEWPSNPTCFREVVSEYSTRARMLALKLLELISESLGLESDYMDKALGRHAQHMVINYYPPCPDPELTYGLPGHKDPNAITLLLQDDVPGLQVLRDGKWVAVHPMPNTFIINIGDQIQALSNDRYKSVLHRAVVNSEKDRFSIPTFYAPSMDAKIEPAAAVVDEKHPRAYRSFNYEEYYEKFWNKELTTDSCLNLFRKD